LNWLRFDNLWLRAANHNVDSKADKKGVRSLEDNHTRMAEEDFFYFILLLHMKCISYCCGKVEGSISSPQLKSHKAHRIRY